MLHLAAIDIGSNAIRLAVARQTHQGLLITYRSRQAVRLGSSVFAQGEISKEIYDDLAQALSLFQNQLGNHRVDHTRAVATSAMREAKNKDQVIEALRKDTGIQVEVISGDEEARLVALAIGQKIDMQQGRHLIIDIGGGSIELVAMIDGTMIKKQSFVIGMVRLLELASKKNTDMMQWLPEFVNEEIKSFISDLPPMDQAIGTGGNMDRFIKLKSFVSSEQGEFLGLEDMLKLQSQLLAVPYKERILKFGLKADRADVIVPAALATTTIMKASQCERIHLPQVGLKDGVLYDLLPRP